MGHKRPSLVRGKCAICGHWPPARKLTLRASKNSVLSGRRWNPDAESQARLTSRKPVHQRLQDAHAQIVAQYLGIIHLAIEG
jgi:hypothetical protein